MAPITKYHKPGGLNGTVVSHSSGGWSIIGFWWGPTSWFGDGRLLTVSSRGGRWWGSFLGSLVRTLIPFMRGPPLWPNHFSMAPFLIASQWGLEFPQMILGMHTYIQPELCRLKYLFIEIRCNRKNEGVFMCCYEIIFKKYFCVKKQSTEQYVQEKKKKSLFASTGIECL